MGWILWGDRLELQNYNEVITLCILVHHSSNLFFTLSVLITPNVASSDFALNVDNVFR